MAALTPVRKRSILVGLTLGALATAGIVVALGGDDSSGGDVSAEGLEPIATVGDVTGRSVPDLELDGFSGGTVALTDYDGRPMVVNFFASWCVPCVREMPDFEAVHQELGDRVAFVGIDVQDSLDDAQELVDDTGVTYDLALDPSGDLLSAIGGIQMPTTALVDADGVVIELVNGAMDADDLRGKLREHFPGVA